jgi:hypothetical protein
VAPNIPDGSEVISVEQQAVMELWLLAIVWMLLHEVEHILVKEQDRNFASWLDEELACDKAAFDWFFSDLNSSGVSQDTPKILGKRAMGALIALFCVVWLSERDRNSHHPLATQRLAILLDEIGERDAGRFWEFAAGLIFVLDKDRAAASVVLSGSLREVVLALAKRLV